jgi:hypothetical protein
MRTNRQLHAEVTKYYYENRILHILATHDKDRELLSNSHMFTYYEELAVMNPQTRALFTKLDIMIIPLYLDVQDVRKQRHPHVTSVADPMRHTFALLPNLTTIVISLGPYPLRIRRSIDYYKRQRIMTLEWLLQRAPRGVQVAWTPTTPPSDDAAMDEKTCWRIMKDRGFLSSET